MLIGGFQKSSLLDFRNNIAAVVFTMGCNFSCPYCHNPELVLGSATNFGSTASFSGAASSDGAFNPLNEKEILDFLKTRVNKLDGVVITGGEPTLHKDLPEFIGKIKELGFLIKLDTNGSNPKMLKDLLDENLLNYIAMDIKAPLDEYENVVRRRIKTEDIQKSMEIIIKSAPDYEFRTTVTDRLLNYNSFVKINSMFEKLGGIKRYYLQKFQKSKHVDETFLNAKTFDDDTFLKIEELFKNSVKEYGLR